ncbi:MAG: hypothetical protein J5507_03195 [Clostridia bacterium]|nr:hypothetical protein [Clostridia bacterium]
MKEVPTNKELEKKTSKQLQVVGGYIIPTNEKIEFPPENSSRIGILSNTEREIIEFKLQGDRYIDIEEFRRAKEEIKKNRRKKEIREALDRYDKRENDEEPSK